MRLILSIAAMAALGCTSIFAADAAAGKAVYEKSCKGCQPARMGPRAPGWPRR